MPVTADARCRMMVVGSLARPLVEKRRSLNSDARPSTERISKKVAPPASTIGSEKLSEAAIERRPCGRWRRQKSLCFPDKAARSG
jgi:hypothetical protein